MILAVNDAKWLTEQNSYQGFDLKQSESFTFHPIPSLYLTVQHSVGKMSPWGLGDGKKEWMARTNEDFVKSSQKKNGKIICKGKKLRYQTSKMNEKERK